MRDERPKLRPEERYRMRRLTDDEMSALTKLARQGDTGPGHALEALWDLILHDAEGVGVADAAARVPKFRVQDYAIADDQLQQLHDAMTKGGRRLPRTIRSIGTLWFNQSPFSHDPEDDDA